MFHPLLCTFNSPSTLFFSLGCQQRTHSWCGWNINLYTGMTISLLFSNPFLIISICRFLYWILLDSKQVFFHRTNYYNQKFLFLEVLAGSELTPMYVTIFCCYFPLGSPSCILNLPCHFIFQSLKIIMSALSMPSFTALNNFVVQ